MADIAINPVTRRVQFTGNTGTGPFAFTFNVLQQSDIVVYKNNVEQTLTTDYTVSLNANGTGSVTLVTALVATDVLVIVGGRELSRTTDFVTAGDLLASSLNEQLDSNVIMSQQLDERVSRTIRSQPGDELTDLYIPLKADRADKLLSFDTEGNVQAQAASDLLTGSVLGANYTKASHTGDGTTIAFSTTEAAGSKNNIQVYIDGVYQNKDTFSISGSTLTFSEAPPLNSAIEFIVGNAVTSLTTDPAVVTYNQGGTGAQDRTLTSKLQETVSVKDFGAVGDGNPEDGTGTDDASAIQAALDAVNLVGGGTVYFPSGVYMIKSGLSVGANTTVIGDGWDLSQIMIHKDAPDFTSNADAMFYLNGGASVATELPMRYVQFRRLSLNGGDNYTTNNDFNGVVARRTIYCSIVDCELKQFDRDAIKLIHNSGEESNTSFTIRNNLIRDCNSDGIVLQRVRNVEICDNIIRTQSGNGIEFEGDASERVHINGNQFNQNQVNAILCAALTNYGYDSVNSTGSNGTHSVHIEGNLFYGNAKQNNDAGGEYLGTIHATGVEDWVISDNKFTENDAHDLYIDTNNGKISNNYFYKSYRHGLFLTSGRNVQVSDNYFINASVNQDNTYDAIHIDSPTCFITNNRVVYDSTVSTPQQKYGLNLTSSATNASVSNNNVLASGSTADYLNSSSSARMVQNFGIGQTGTFEVKLTSNQNNIATGSDVDVRFNSEVTDIGGNFDSSNYKFVAPFDGIYNIEAGIRLVDVDTAATYYYARIAIFDDSDTLQRSYLNIIDPNFSADLDYLTLNVSATVKLENDWYVKVQVKQQGGTSQTDIDANSWFTGNYVADYS